MQSQPENQLHSSEHMPAQFNEGGHALFDTDQAIRSLISAMEHHLLYESHIQDQELITIANKQQAALKQIYNTIVHTLKTGQAPSIPTQTYQMEESNTIVYGMQPSKPKTPSQSINELNDESISSFILAGLKSIATAFTTTALESTNPILRRILADSVPNIIEMGYETFLYQNKRQYYQVAQLKQEDMQSIINGYAPTPGTMQH